MTPRIFAHWYAATPDRRSRQVLTDLLVVGWLVVCLWLAHGVHGRFVDLADQVRRTETATSGISSGLTQAGDLLGQVPLVGSGIDDPFQAAAGASDRLGSASLDAADRTEQIGTWLSVLLVIGFFGPVGVPYGRRRYRSAREAGRIELLARAPGGTDLLALRALTTLPVHDVAAAVPGAADGWRRGVPAVVQALAELQLREAGLDPVRVSRS
ncbi:hypothetical protein [Nocardioides sp.]|uniref:hypothetical protein n=1 Tax=Nocardioides sp. TaxID=35761 RepID=UPI0037841795